MLPSPPLLNTPDLWTSFFPAPKPEGTKYDCSFALTYGGEEKMLLSRAALRSLQTLGIGMITVAVATGKVARLYAEKLAEVHIRETASLPAWNKYLIDPKHSAILIGPGLGIGANEAAMITATLGTEKLCVLQGDALANFAGAPETLLSKLHPKCVLMIDEAEFESTFATRLKPATEPSDRILQAAKLANAVLLVQGTTTIIAAPDGQVVVNEAVPPWASTAGAAEILAGVILALAMQRMPPFWAAAAATWLHGETVKKLGANLTAKALLTGIPETIKGLARD